jgi:hypothetical protein
MKTTPRDPMLGAGKLKERDWTRTMIQAFCGDPDVMAE